MTAIDEPRKARKARFLAALLVSGMTMEQWATDNNTTQGYVSNLLAGRRTNERLEKKITAFIHKHLENAA